MPIRRYFEDGIVSTPEALSAMNKALRDTTQILGIDGDEKQRQIVARFIIRISQEDERLDAAALRDRVLAALGGVAYSIPASPQFAPISQIAE